MDAVIMILFFYTTVRITSMNMYTIWSWYWLW